MALVEARTVPSYSNRYIHTGALSGADSCHVTFFSPADSDRSLSHFPHSAGLISDQPESGPSQSRPVHASRLAPAAGDCKRELLPRAAPRSQRWHSGMARQGHSRMRVGQVADAMRVRAGVAPRVASGDPAASKGKSAGGASFGKRRVGREERCAAPHARAVHVAHLHKSSPPLATCSPCADDSNTCP